MCDLFPMDDILLAHKQKLLGHYSFHLQLPEHLSNHLTMVTFYKVDVRTSANDDMKTIMRQYINGHQRI